MAAENLQLYLLGAEKLLRCRWDGRTENVEILNSALDGETVREVARDPFNAKKLYAATLTEIHVSEDDGVNWQWLPSGGIDRRDIWTMAVHPTRANEIYVGTLPAASRETMRQSIVPFLPWTNVPAVLVAAAKSKSVPTAVTG